VSEEEEIQGLTPGNGESFPEPEDRDASGDSAVVPGPGTNGVAGELPIDPFAEAVERQAEPGMDGGQSPAGADPAVPLTGWERPDYNESMDDETLEEIGISIAGEPEEPGQAERHEDFAPEPVLTLMASHISGISRQMGALMAEFQDKIRHDAYREIIIERLHAELQVYKEDIFKKPLQSVVTDLIKVIDDLRRLTAHYRSRELTPEDLPKLLQVLTDIPQDLEEIFLWQGISSYNVEGGAFDPARQRITRKVPTTDQALDKSVAERTLPGYEWDGKVIRPETVAVYVYQEEATEEEA